MSVKPICPARKASTATSSAAFSATGSSPPASPARYARPRHGKRSRSGSRNSQVPRIGQPRCVPTSRPRRAPRTSPGRVMPVGAASTAYAMGRRMSVGPNCAFRLPSRKRTAAWIRLCGCTTTPTCDSGRPYRLAHSMTSSPLFISVALSIVTFGPMLHDGCFSACSGVTPLRSAGPSRNGPPDAVRITSATSAMSSPVRHWNTPVCSESMGTTRPPPTAAASHIRCAAVTIASLVASATACPASSAARVGASPIRPLMAFTTTPVGRLATSAGSAITRTPGSASRACASTPASTLTSSGRNSRTCAASNSTLRPAASAVTRQPRSRATSSVCVPMLPVLPSTAIPRPAPSERLIPRMLDDAGDGSGGTAHDWRCPQRVKTLMFRNRYVAGTANSRLSTRSRNPPCPGRLLPLSLVFSARLSRLSDRSPS